MARPSADLHAYEILLLMTTEPQPRDIRRLARKLRDLWWCWEQLGRPNSGKARE